ncbi:MAG: DUF4340 domain-containing protein [Acidobacteriota bacterium]
MRPRSLAILFVLVVALVSFIWFYEKDLPSSAERAELEKKVLKAPRDQVEEIRIESEGRTVVLERASSQTDSAGGGGPETTWRISEPIDSRADSEMVDELLDMLTRLEKKRTLESVELDEAGFDPPRARLFVSHGDDATEFSVGNDIPASSSMLSRLEGSSEVVVVDAGLWPSLERSGGDWRARDLVEARSADISRVELSGVGGDVVLARSDGDRFWTERPFEDWASEERVADLLAAITSLRAESFVDDAGGNEEQFGLSPPRGFLVVETASSSSERIEIGTPVPDTNELVYIRVAGQIAEAATDLTETVERSPEQWRSLSLTTLQTYQIDRLIIEDSERGGLTLTRSGADWLRDEDEISFTTVSDLLYAIVDARATAALEIDSSDGVDLEKRMLEVSLFSESDQESFSIFENGGDELVKVRVDGRSSELELERKRLVDIEEKISEVRHAESLGGDNFANDAGSTLDESLDGS